MTERTGWRSNPAVRGVLAIVGGTGLGQLVLFLAAPVLSRLYPPGDFGPFAVINALVLPLATVATLRLELAVPLPEEERDAHGLVRMGLLTTGLLSILALVIAVIFHEPLGGLVGLPAGSENLLPWAPVVAAAMAAYALLNQAAIRARMYGAIARRNVLQAVAVTVFQVVAGFLGAGAQGLAAGLALGQLVGVLALAHSLRPTGLWHRDGTADRPALLRRYKVFPLAMMPSGLVNTLGIQAPVLLSASLFGATVAGLLGMTQRVLLMPVALIGIALAQVYLGEFSAAKRAGASASSLERRFISTSKQLFAVGVLFAAVMLTTGPWLFSTFLGAQWEMSGHFARALAVGLAAQMVASPLSQTLIVMGRQVQQALWDVARLMLVVAALLGGAHMGLGAEGTMWLFGAATVISYLAAWLLSWRAVRNPRAASPTAEPIAVAAP